jgi:hypothetical protein
LIRVINSTRDCRLAVLQNPARRGCRRGPGRWAGLGWAGLLQVRFGFFSFPSKFSFGSFQFDPGGRSGREGSFFYSTQGGQHVDDASATTKPDLLILAAHSIHSCKAAQRHSGTAAQRHSGAAAVAGAAATAMCFWHHWPTGATSQHFGSMAEALVAPGPWQPRHVNWQPGWQRWSPPRPRRRSRCCRRCSRWCGRRGGVTSLGRRAGSNPAGGTPKIDPATPFPLHP